MQSSPIFLPIIRARWHFVRRDYDAAAQIYERMLERQPGRVRLYLWLSHVYLRLGRKDDCAMKIYQAALRSNLTTPIREEINMLVAQRYLHEEKLADEMIPVLEGALKTARRALKQYAEAKS